MSKRLCIIPAGAVFDKQLCRSDLAVLCALGVFANRDRRCWPSTTTLATVLGISDRQIRRCLSKLEICGHIFIQHRPGRSSIYTINLEQADPGHRGSGVTPDTGVPGSAPNPGHPGSGTPDTQVPVPRTPRFRHKDSKKDTKKDDGDSSATEGAKYVFAGKVIRLIGKDFTEWSKRYHAIPDISAELKSLDAWYVHQDPQHGKGWFHRAQRSLNDKHQRLLAEQAAKAHQREDEARRSDGVC